MIAKLEGTYSYVQHNIEQLQNPTMGVTIKNKFLLLNLSTLEHTLAKRIS